MTVEVEKLDAKFERVKLRLETSDKRRFHLVIDNKGFHFYSAVSSAGTPMGNPVVKSVDEVLIWFGADGKNKPFVERVGLRRRK